MTPGAIIVVTLGNGQTQLAQCIDTVPEPTMHVTDHAGKEFTVPVRVCSSATKSQVDEFWKLKARHSFGQWHGN